MPGRTVDQVGAVLDSIGTMPALMVGLVLGVIMFLDATPITGLFVPGDLTVVTVVASGSPAEGVLAVAGVLFGTLLSWSLFFLLGNRVGPRLRDGRLGRWIGRDRWDKAERLLAGRAARALVLVQFLPVLNSVVPTVAGVLGMRYRHFIRYAWPGATIWTVFFVCVGVWAGRANTALFGEAGSPLQFLVFAAPGLIAGGIMLIYLHRQFAARRDRSPSGRPDGAAPDTDAVDVAA